MASWMDSSDGPHAMKLHRVAADMLSFVEQNKTVQPPSDPQSKAQVKEALKAIDEAQLDEVLDEAQRQVRALKAVTPSPEESRQLQPKTKAG